MSRPRPRIFDLSTLVLAMLAGSAAFYIYRRDGLDAVLRIGLEDARLLMEMMPKVLGGCLIGAFVHLLVPGAMVVRWVGADSGMKGLVIATLCGILLPGGPFTIFPIAAAFLTLGAEAGAALAFISAWSLMGLNRSVIWEMPFMGVEFTLWRSFLALPLPLLLGLAVRLVTRRPA